MKTDNVNPRVQRVVNKRYKRDLLVAFNAVVGIMIIAVLVLAFLKPHVQALDNLEPEVPTAFFTLGFIVIAFFKYARK